jgi:hypothetical protein
MVLIQSLDLDCVYVADAYSEFDHVARERRTINQDDRNLRGFCILEGLA